jgi:magnesium-transporting ATPase (P-type)
MQSVGARRGVVISSARALESGARVSCVVFDKTGTLTQGEHKVLHRFLLLPEEGGDVNTCVNTDVHVSAAERRLWAGACMCMYMYYTHSILSF